MQYEREAARQKACAMPLRGWVLWGHIPEMTAKEISRIIEELEDSLYQSKDAYIKLHRRNKQNG